MFRKYRNVVKICMKIRKSENFSRSLKFIPAKLISLVRGNHKKNVILTNVSTGESYSLQNDQLWWRIPLFSYIFDYFRQALSTKHGKVMQIMNKLPPKHIIYLIKSAPTKGPRISSVYLKQVSSLVFVLETSVRRARKWL